MTPPALERLVKKCMNKDPDERWQSARDLSSELKWIAEDGGSLPAMATGAKLRSFQGGDVKSWLGALVIVFLAASIVSTVFYLRLVRAPARAIISEILPPEKTQFNFESDYGGPPVLSPDGAAVAFSTTDANGKNMLWVRSLGSLAAQPLAGTEGGALPFWSPDSRRLGFFADGKLKTLELSGGPARVVADAPSTGCGSWNRQGTLLFVPDYTKGLYQVAASGGAPVPVLEFDKSKYRYGYWPKFLPDGKHFLYYARTFDPTSSGIYFASMDGKENRLLHKAEGTFTYGSGYLLYLLERALMAQAFDPEQGQLNGDAHPVAERVALDSDVNGLFDISENGVLIYQAGDSLKEKRVIWFDLAGKELSLGEKGSYDSLRLSPDGAKLAYKAGEPTPDIWVDELARGVHIRLTNDPGIGYTQSDLVAGRPSDSVRRDNGNGHYLPDELQRVGWQGSATGKSRPRKGGGPRAGLQMPGSSSSCAETPPAHKMSGSCLSRATANRASWSKTPLMGNSLLTADGWRIALWNLVNFRFAWCRLMPLRF